MENGPFNRLISLVAFDQSIFAQQKKLELIAAEIEKIQNLKIHVSKQVEQEKLVVQHLKKEVGMRELELRALDDQEAATKERISTVANNREYQVLKRELEEVQQEQLKAEEALIAAWNKHENGQKLSNNKVTAQEQELLMLQQKLEAQQQERIMLQEQIDQETHKRPEYVKDVPEEWLDRYSRMRHDVHNPIVTLEGRSCVACFHELSSAELLVLNRKQLVPCQGCYRFLYLEKK